MTDDRKSSIRIKLHPSNVGSGGWESDSERIVIWAPNKYALIQLLIKEVKKLLKDLEAL